MKSQKVERFTARGFTAQQLAEDLKGIPSNARAVDYNTESHSYTGDNAPTRFVQEIILTFEAPLKDEDRSYRVRSYTNRRTFSVQDLTRKEADAQLLTGMPVEGETRYLEVSDKNGAWHPVSTWEFTGTSWKRK